MKLTRIALTGSLLLVLAGCGNDSPITDPPQNPNPPTNPGTPGGGFPGFPGGGLPSNPGTPANGISGTVTAPAGGDISNTVVGVCPGTATTATCKDSGTQRVTVDTSGAYSFTDLSGTEYIVIAVKDATGDGEIGNGDYGGAYTTDGTTFATVTPPKTDVNITMEVLDDGNGTNTPPETPGTGSGSISGTLLPPGTVTGASAVFACYLTEDQNNPCDSNLSDFVQLAAGSGFSYSIDDLSAGQYAVVGYSDADGNDSIEDANDYVGIYPSFDAFEAVSPPAVSIDIPMITNTEFGAPSVQSAVRTRILEAAKASLNNYLLKRQLEQALKTLR